MYDRPVFWTGWVVNGWFNGNYELTFRLHSPAHDSLFGTLLRAFWVFVMRRRRLNSDLLALAAFLREQALFLNTGKPTLPDGCIRVIK